MMILVLTAVESSRVKTSLLISWVFIVIEGVMFQCFSDDSRKTFTSVPHVDGSGTEIESDPVTELVEVLHYLLEISFAVHNSLF